MKKYFSILALAFVLFSASQVQAQSDSFATPIIAIVDMQSLMRDSEAGKSIQKQANEMRDGYRKTLTEKEKELRTEEKNLLAKKSTLSQEAFNTEREKFEKKLISTQKEVMGKQEEIEKAFAEAMNTLRTEAVQIIAKKAESKKASLVLPRQNVVIVDQDLDITDEVLKELNGKLKTVKVKTK